MREHKYEAWHETAKEMLKEINVGDVFRWKADGQPIKIREWTGLKDKNGKEIYEGDVVKGKTYLGNMEMFTRFIGEVKYYAPKFELDGVNKYKRCREELNSSFEVIGNVYENADLFAEVTP